jgi:hypothetical protein
MTPGWFIVIAQSSRNRTRPDSLHEEIVADQPWRDVGGTSQ